MDEIFEIYLRLTYKFVGKMIYGEDLRNQPDVPLWVKIIAAIVPLISLVFLGVAIVFLS
jgi:hypothetical protein